MFTCRILRRRPVRTDPITKRAAPAHEALAIRDKQDVSPLSPTPQKDQARRADAEASADFRGTRSEPIDNLLEELRSEGG